MFNIQAKNIILSKGVAKIIFNLAKIDENNAYIKKVIL